MPQGTLAWITPVSGGHPDQGLPGSEYPDQGLPGGGGRPTRPSHPVALPPLPPGVAPPIALPPTLWPPTPPGEGGPTNPIVIPGTPEHPIALPPGMVWPPLDPSDGVQGKALLLAWVVGTGKYRWVVVDVPEGPSTLPLPGGGLPPRPQPK
jgi:hypothetical protein